jgi:hypothetical protein
MVNDFLSSQHIGTPVFGSVCGHNGTDECQNRKKKKNTKKQKGE